VILAPARNTSGTGRLQWLEADWRLMMRAVVLFPGEDGYWVAECPSLPGCVSQGATKAEAIANIKEAIEGWIETMKAHGQPIPDEPFETQVVCV